jgi:hypothetical protein
VTGTADRSGWAYGEAEGGEWLTIYGSAHTAPVLYPSREAAAGALAASPLAGRGLTVAHVTEVRHPGMTGPRPYAYRITPGTCENPEAGAYGASR